MGCYMCLLGLAREPYHVSNQIGGEWFRPPLVVFWLGSFVVPMVLQFFLFGQYNLIFMGIFACFFIVADLLSWLGCCQPGDLFFLCYCCFCSGFQYSLFLPPKLPYIFGHIDSPLFIIYFCLYYKKIEMLSRNNLKQKLT